MSTIRRPKTANPCTFQYSTDFAANNFNRPKSRPLSQLSTISYDNQEAQRPKSAISRKNTEIQTDDQQFYPQNASPLPTGMPSTIPQGGGNLFYPYLLPFQPNQQQPLMQPMYGVFYGPYTTTPQMNGPQQGYYPAMQQLPERPKTSIPRSLYPMVRVGRNGSCWRHIKQCTGNLGNNIMFIDDEEDPKKRGAIKEEDCRKFPPHGYFTNKSYPMSVSQRLAPQVNYFNNQNGGRFNQRRPTYSNNFHDRARNDFKFWYDDKKKSPITPNTIQGRIMKSGIAY